METTIQLLLKWGPSKGTRRKTLARMMLQILSGLLAHDYYTPCVVPLNVLLSHAVLKVTREAESLLSEVNVVQWSDFWRVADGSDRGSLHLNARISRRAMKTYIDAQAKAGTLAVDSVAGLRVSVVDDPELRAESEVGSS